VANYPRTNFGVSYLESALFLRAEFDGEEGNYCLAMPVTNDMALILGREVFGYPKKMANIQFRRQGKEIKLLIRRPGAYGFPGPLQPCPEGRCNPGYGRKDAVSGKRSRHGHHRSF
jgi:acetoacetate decarboxylase